MKQIFYIILFICALSLQVTAQNNSIFPKGEIGKNTTNYTGTIWLSELNHSDTIFYLGLAQATFAPASKLDWHIHPAGQY
jgi:hypothetical protein